MTKELITIDPQEIKVFAEEGGKFVFKPTAEENLYKLLTLQKMVDDLVEQVKEKIAEAGMQIDPGFKGVKGEKVKALFRSYGTKYDYDKSKTGDLQTFLKERTYYSVDGPKVDKYIETVGEIPDGIIEKSRDKKLSLTLADDEEGGAEE